MGIKLSLLVLCEVLGSFEQVLLFYIYRYVN